MTDQPTTPPQPPAPITDPEPTPTTDDVDNAAQPRRSGPASGFMLYDLSELRFVGARRESRKAANDNAVKVKGHRYEVREV